MFFRSEYGLNFVIISENSKISLEKNEDFEDGTFATMMSRSYWLRASEHNFRYKTNVKILEKMRMIDENFYWQSSYWILQSNSFLYELLNNFILETHQHGFIKRFESLNAYNKITIPKEKGPEILTIFMLSAGFYVWLATVLSAILTFIGELAVSHFITKISKIRILRITKTSKSLREK